MSISATTWPEKSVSFPRTFDAHVALLTNYIPPYAVPVYEELARRVRKLTILVSTPMEAGRHWKPAWGTLDVRVQRTVTFERPWTHPSGFCEPTSIHLPWDTWSLLRSLRPDVIMSAQLGVRSLLSACFAAWTKTPLILFVNLSEHQEAGRGWVRNRLRRWLIRRASCIAVNGQSGSRYLQSLGADPRRLFCVPYAALPDLFDRIPLERLGSLSHKLLYVGQLTERKGLQPFTMALARWAQRNPERVLEFDLAGSGSLEATLRSLQLPANMRLRLLGEQSAAELANCYAKAGILVLPTLSDEWGLVVNEALAAGVPVLGSTYSQAVDELCIEGQTGWRFRPNVAGEMDNAIERALSTSDDVLDQMRLAGHEMVKNLTPAYSAAQFLATIIAAAGDKVAGRQMTNNDEFAIS